MMANRNNGIDILKCLAAFLITNSHMDMMYPKFGFMATGGAIGDALFFFCSGFTLLLKPQMGGVRFGNWYKRRINRIYPTIFAVAIMRCLFFGNDDNIVNILLYGGGWFISCIMLYYLAIYPIGLKYSRYIWHVIGVVAVLSAAWFFLADRPVGYNMYKSANTLKGVDDPMEGGYLKWLLFFTTMMLGAWAGKWSGKIKYKGWKDVMGLLVSVTLFYMLYLIPRKVYAIEWLQFFSFIPLMTCVYYFFKVMGSKVVDDIYSKLWVYVPVRFIGGLCLEIYLVQFSLFTDKMNYLFPFNLLIMFAIIIISAYLLRCGARLFSQTFKGSDYEWQKIIAWK